MNLLWSVVRARFATRETGIHVIVTTKCSRLTVRVHVFVRYGRRSLLFSGGSFFSWASSTRERDLSAHRGDDPDPLAGRRGVRTSELPVSPEDPRLLGGGLLPDLAQPLSPGHGVWDTPAVRRARPLGRKGGGWVPGWNFGPEGWRGVLRHNKPHATSRHVSKRP